MGRPDAMRIRSKKGVMRKQSSGVNRFQDRRPSPWLYGRLGGGRRESVARGGNGWGWSDATSGIAVMAARGRVASRCSYRLPILQAPKSIRNAGLDNSGTQ